MLLEADEIYQGTTWAQALVGPGVDTPLTAIINDCEEKICMRMGNDLISLEWTNCSGYTGEQDTYTIL